MVTGGKIETGGDCVVLEISTGRRKRIHAIHHRLRVLRTENRTEQRRTYPRLDRPRANSTWSALACLDPPPYLDGCPHPTLSFSGNSSKSQQPSGSSSLAASVHSNSRSMLMVIVVADGWGRWQQRGEIEVMVDGLRRNVEKLNRVARFFLFDEE